MFTSASIGYAIGVMAVAFITYLKGKSEGREEGMESGIEKTLDWLRLNNMVRWRMDDNDEIELLDINGNEVQIDE